MLHCFQKLLKTQWFILLHWVSCSFFTMNTHALVYLDSVPCTHTVLMLLILTTPPNVDYSAAENSPGQSHRFLFVWFIKKTKTTNNKNNKTVSSCFRKKKNSFAIDIGVQIIFLWYIKDIKRKCWLTPALSSKYLKYFSFFKYKRTFQH